MAKSKSFDVIGTLPGFNQHCLLAEGVPASELGATLAKLMTHRPPGGYHDPDPCVFQAVLVHIHPTFWDKKNFKPNPLEITHNL